MQPIQGAGVELTDKQPVAVVVQAEGAVGVAPNVYARDSNLATDSPPAKKYWVLSLLSLIGMALIADGSFKAFVACPITVKAEPGTGLESGPVSVDQNCNGATCSKVSLPVPGHGTVLAPTCAMALSLSATNAKEQYNTCTKVSGCEFYYKSTSPITDPTQLDGKAACTAVERTASSTAGNIACGCGLGAQFQLNAKLTIDINVHLGQSEICVGCSCTTAVDPALQGIESSCAKNGGCLDTTALQAGENSEGGGLNDYNVAFDKLAKGDLCYGISDLSSKNPPSWVEPVTKLVVILPAIILALLLVYYLYLSFKKKTVADASSSGKCCGAMIYNCTFFIAVLLAGIIGLVFVFVLPKAFNDSFENESSQSHILKPTATALGTFTITHPQCEAGAGAKAELVGGIIALVAWFLSCKCSGCCRF